MYRRYVAIDLLRRREVIVREDEAGEELGEIPEDWELLPSGDAFVTSTVKAAGMYWLAWKPRTRQRPPVSDRPVGAAVDDRGAPRHNGGH